MEINHLLAPPQEYNITPIYYDSVLVPISLIIDEIEEELKEQKK